MKKTIKVHIYFVALLFLLISCTTKSKKVDDQSMTVQLIDVDSARPLPLVSPMVDPANPSAFGPLPPQELTFSKANAKKEPIVGLFLGPGLYRATRHIQVLKFFKKKLINIRVLSGSGFGAIVATLYSYGLSPNEIEWMFFKFYSKVANVRPYSKKWFESIEEVFISKIKKESRVESLEISLFFPLLSTRKKKVIFIKSGYLKEALRSSLVINSSPRDDYMSSISSTWDLKQQFLEVGADIAIGVNVIGKESVVFKKADNYLVGVFGRAISNQDELCQSLDLCLGLLAPFVCQNP